MFYYMCLLTAAKVASSVSAEPSAVMTEKELFTIFIPALVTLIGFLFTYFMLKRQFKNSINISLHEDRKKIYLKAYQIMEEALKSMTVVFDYRYSERLFSIWIEISIIGNKQVYRSFTEFYKYVIDIYKKYKKYSSENDWEKKEIDEDGNENPNFSHSDIKEYEYLMKKYKDEHMPSEHKLSEMTQKTKEEIQKDLGTNK